LRLLPLPARQGELEQGGAVAGLIAGAIAEGLKQGIDELVKQIDSVEDTRILLRGLSGEIVTWAKSESLTATPEDLTAGLELALVAISRAAITLEDLARADYDHKQIAATVTSKAHAGNNEWAVSSEARYVIAERAIRSAYARMTRIFVDREPAQMASFAELKTRLGRLDQRLGLLEKEHSEVVQGLAHSSLTVPWTEFREASALARSDLSPDTLPNIDRMTWVRKSTGASGIIPTPLAIIGDGGLGKSILAGQLYDELSEAKHPVLLVPCSSVPRSAQLHSPADVDVALCQSAAGRADVPGLSRALQELDQHEELWIIIHTLDLLLNDSSARAIQDIIGGLAGRHRLIVFCREREWRDFNMSVEFDALSELPLPRLGPTEIVDWGRQFLAQADHDARPGFEVSLARAAQTAGASEVLGVPLRLAMACELYSAREEIPDDLTVVSLYREYWSRRVGRDREGLRGEAAREQERVALSMAEAIWIASQERLVEWVSAPAGISLPALGRLMGEGVIRESAYQLRFFHQTFAEFAVAQYLLSRHDPTDLARLRAQLNGNNSGSWGIAAYLLTPELELDRYTQIAEVIPCDSSAGVRILLRSALERYSDAESDGLVEDLATKSPELMALFPELFLGVNLQRLESAVAILLSLVVNQTSTLNRLADVAALLCLELNDEVRTRLLGPALLSLADRRTNLSGNVLHPVLVRMMNAFPCPLGPRDIRLLIDVYSHLPAPARAAAIKHVLGSVHRIDGASIGDFAVVALGCELPSGSVDDAVELLLRVWSDQEQRARFEWRSWSDLLLATYPKRWDAVQTRVAARMAEDDETVFVELLKEALHPTSTTHRPRINNAAEFMATWWPKRVVPALQQTGVAKDGMAVATASVMIRRMIPEMDAAAGERLIVLLQDVVDWDPLNAWPTMLRLGVRYSEEFGTLELRLRAFLQDPAIDQVARARTRRNCFEALLYELPPRKLGNHLDLLSHLSAGSEPADRINRALLYATRAPVSLSARVQVTPIIKMGQQPPAAIAAAKALRNGLAHWVAEELDTVGVAWFLDLLDTRVTKAAEHLIESVQERLHTTHWDVAKASRLVDRLRVSLQRQEDAQVSDKLRILLIGIIHLDGSGQGLLTQEQIESVLTAYRTALEAALRTEGPTGQLAAALWAGFNSSVSGLALGLLPQERAETLMIEILQTDSTAISNRATRYTAATVVAFLQRYPLRFPLIETLWGTMPEPAKAAVAESLDRGLIPGKRSAAQRLLDIGAPPAIAARLLTIVDTGGSRRSSSPRKSSSATVEPL
jgi:hypothetical protein